MDIFQGIDYNSHTWRKAMQEIASNVFIEHNSLGLVAGIIRTEKGTVLIDSPVRQDEAGSWRGGTARMVTGHPKYMIVLDTNYDRLLSVKGSDCVVVAHSDSISPIRSRMGSKPSSEETTPSQENYEQSVAGNRVLPPELNFDSNLTLYVDGLSIELEHHPGSNFAGIWAAIPERQVIFVGDTVVVDQPPFLAYSNPEIWEEDLKLLSSRKYKDYQIISSRSGVVTKDQIKLMAKHVSFIRKTFEKLRESNAPIEEWYKKIPAILERISELDLFNNELFYNRLHWGITTYYEQNCRERG